MIHTRIVVTHYGGPEALQALEEDRPEPKRGEVRVKVLAAGVALPDILAREGIHPETPHVPFTPGWDLIGVVDRLGDDVFGIETGQIVAAMPISGAYAEFVCLPQRELVPVPAGLEPSETVSLILNYITAYQMLHRSAQVRPGQPRFDSRRGRRGRDGTIATWTPCRIGDVWYVFIARSIRRYRSGWHPD